MAAQTSVKKQSFEDELETLDTDLEETEAKLTKLQLLVQVSLKQCSITQPTTTVVPTSGDDCVCDYLY